MHFNSTPPQLNPACIERFWSYVKRTDACWTWQGAMLANGYGSFGVGTGRQCLAHRVAYYIATGDWAPLLDHLCRVRHCVNPSHLESVTHRENLHRGRPVWKLEAEQTHCKRGHAYSDDTYTHPVNGHRSCRLCRREVRPRGRSYCNAGHHFAPETTYIYPSGYRICLVCRPEFMKL